MHYFSIYSYCLFIFKIFYASKDFHLQKVFLEIILCESFRINVFVGKNTYKHKAIYI